MMTHQGKIMQIKKIRSICKASLAGFTDTQVAQDNNVARVTVYRYRNLLKDAGIKAIDTLEVLSDDELMSIIYKTLDMSNVKGNTVRITRPNPELHLPDFKELQKKF